MKFKRFHCFVVIFIEFDARLQFLLLFIDFH